MRIVDRNGRPIANSWAHDDEGAAGGKKAILPLKALLDRNPTPLIEGLGVILPSEKPAELVVPYLASLGLVCIDFPKFRDGRGFTIARKLRQLFAYAGDIRAVGHVLPDQFTALISCGFTSILTPLGHPPEQWAASLFGDENKQAPAGPLLLRLLGRGVGEIPSDEREERQ